MLAIPDTGDPGGAGAAVIGSTTMTELRVRAAETADRDRIVALLTARWGGTTVVAHGRAYEAADLPALLAERDGQLAGLLTYEIAAGGLEVVTLDAVMPGVGAGTALLAAATGLAREAGADRLWLVTSTDNLDALRFYQRRGLRIVGVSPGAVDEARQLKPSIPLVGAHGIELHDELTLELRLDEAAGSRPALWATVLDSPDARELAAFYRRLLGWPLATDEPDWVTLRAPGGGAGLSFQTERAYVRPVWPAGPGDPRMMSHLDIVVDDLPSAVAHAVDAGAVLADFQPQDDVRVCLDPAGHPFCLFLRD